ncbi:MAG TPA: protein-glutamate O-methyltransferase CheR [Solirubrobacteraceae bacterium]|nr:protein-glutamate O-methyltransferase CheR [Solirubrobacteraceae bacterium]
MTTPLREVAAIIYRESGIRIPERQHSFLEAALDRVGAGPTAEAFLRELASPLRRQELIGRLIEEVTIKETSFLRDRRQLEAIDWHELLEEARANGAERIRVWTAACATGEEGYTLALLAHEAFAPAPPPVEILATDISTGAIEHARAGAYRPRSVHGIEPALRSRYFHDQSDRLVVGDRLRELVSFGQHNLISDPFPPLGEERFQLILCRNVLIYFDGQTVGRVLDSFAAALAGSGTLVLGVADALCASASRLAEGSGNGDAGSASSGARRPHRPRRRPLGRLAVPAPVGGSALLGESDRDSSDAVIAQTSRAIEHDPLDAGAYYRRGLAELELGDPTAAAASLRRALFVEPGFGLAAFKLGGAHEARGDLAAARRAYQQALRALEPDERHEPYLDQIDIADVVAAAQARLDALSAPVA